MRTDELIVLLDELRKLPGENEWLEFKEAKNNYDFNKIGKYFSALSNEANLRGKPSGWLIFGVDDEKRSIVGSNYRNSKVALDSLKQEVADKTENGLTFTEIFELKLPEGRVIMFQIPAAPAGIPTAWEGHFYGRNGESICPLSIKEFEEIRRQGRIEDWSAAICDKATIYDLEPNAIAKARIEFKNKHPKLVAEVDIWDDITFLNKAKVTVNGNHPARKTGI